MIVTTSLDPLFSLNLRDCTKPGWYQSEEGHFVLVPDTIKVNSRVFFSTLVSNPWVIDDSAASSSKWRPLPRGEEISIKL